jgi:hypothetical protein
MYYAVIAAEDPGKTAHRSDNSDIKSADEALEASLQVPTLKASLERLKSEAVIRSTKNKELLSKRMLELRTEIKTLRNNPYAKAGRRSYSETTSASLVDLQG